MQESQLLLMDILSILVVLVVGDHAPVLLEAFEIENGQRVNTVDFKAIVSSS